MHLNRFRIAWVLSAATILLICARLGYSQNTYGSAAKLVTWTDVTAGQGLNNTGYQPAVTYPIPITVTGFSGSVSTIGVTMHHITDKFVANTGAALFGFTDFLLISPDGRAFSLWAQACDVTFAVTTGVDLVLADSGTNAFSVFYNNDVSHLFPCNGIASNATFQPSYRDFVQDFSFKGAYSAPNGASWSSSKLSTYLSPTGYFPSCTGCPGPAGSSTFTSVYQGMGPSQVNGTWYLYWIGSVSQTGQSTTIGDGTNPAITITITGSSAAASTTMLTSSVNPVTVTPPATSSSSTIFSATVTPNPGAGVAVDFQDISNTGSPQNLACSPVNTNASGVAQCTATFTTQGAHVIQASFTGTGSVGPSSGTVTETVNWATTSPSTNTFCNTGNISIPLGSTGITGVDPASAYPATLTVTGLTGVIRDLTFTMDITGLDPGGFSAMLYSPANAKALEIWSYAGGGGLNPPPLRTLTLDDNGAGGHPQPLLASGVTSGTYQPTSNVEPFNPTNYCVSSPCNGVVISSGAPSLFDMSGPAGIGSLVGDFGGLDPNDTWQLYMVDRFGPQTVMSRWCLNFTLTNGTPTHASLQADSTASLTGGNVMLTASVTTGGNSVGSNGTVSFMSDGTIIPSGSGISVVNGQAILTTTALTEGTHNLVARFDGTSNLGPSTSTPVVHRVDDASTETPSCGPSGSCTAKYCNTPAQGVNGILTPGGNFLAGAGTPYPSNIFVAHLPGTINDVSISLNQFQTMNIPEGSGSPQAIRSLLVGPNGGNLDFFSNVPAGVGGPNINLVFSDAGAAIPINPQNGMFAAPFQAGTYQPTSWGPNTNGAGPGNTQYPACPISIGCTSPTPIGPPAPALINYAQPAGNSTLDGMFGSSNGNGTWSLFDLIPNSGNHIIIGSWCLNFTENRPTVTISGPSTGTFTQGQAAPALFAITVHNSSSTGPTGGVLTVSTTMPNPGLTPTGAGAGSDASWTCTPNGRTMTCTNSTDVAADGNYPPLVLAATVDQTAPTSGITLQETVSGGGALGSPAATSNTDTITILPAPVLSVSKTHSGTFTQGLTGGEWDVTVSVSPANSVTAGTTTVQDTLPTGYTVANFGSTDATWTCGSNANVVNCTSVQAIAGGSSFLPIQIFVTVAGNSPASVTNNVAAFGGGDFVHNNITNAATNTDTVNNVIQVPDLTIAKAPVGSFSDGQQGAQYTVTVTNNGGGATTGTITVTDTLPASMTYVSGSSGWNCSASGQPQVVSCTNPGPVTGNGGTLVLTLTVNIAVNAPTPATNAASVACQCNPAENNTSNNSTSIQTAIAQLPDLTISKAPVGSFSEGQQNAQYTITITNGGGGATTGTVTVSDTLPTGFTYASGSNGWNCSASGQPQVVSCTNPGPVTANGGTLALTLTVNIAANAATPATNAASVSCQCNPAESNSNNNSTSIQTVVTQLPDLTISKAPVGSFSDGQQGAQYTITVTNGGGAATTGTITITDTLPVSMTYVSGSNGWNCSASGQPQVVSCTNPGPLAASGTLTLTLTVNIAANAPTSVTNVASVACQCNPAESNTNNNSTSVQTSLTAIPDLTIAKAPVNTFSQGQQSAQYTVTVTNGGGGPTTGTISVSDTLPAGFTYVSGSNGWVCSASGQPQVVSCTNPGPVTANGGTLVLTLTVNIATNAGTPATNAASVSCQCNPAETNTGNNSTSIQTAVTQLPNLSITKHHTDPFTINDQGDTFTITVTNNGSAPTGGTVTVSDTLPAGIAFVSGTGTGWSCSSGDGTHVTCTDTATAIAANGGTSTIILSVNVAGNAGSPLSNTAVVSCTCTQSTTANNTSNADSITVQQVLKYALNINVSPSGGGTATPTSGSTFVSGPVPITASPNTGYGFVNWTGGTFGNANSTSTNVTLGAAPLTITANFSLANNMTPNFTVTGGAITYNRGTQKYSQMVALTNNGTALSTVALALDNVSTGITVLSPTGTTSVTSPAGSPYFEVGPIGAGNTVNITIQFTRTGTGPITYTPRVLGPGPR